MEYGLIGEKLSHSFSKIIHNQLCDYSYDLVSLPKEDLHGFLTQRNFHGLNVTIPYKETVIPYCDFISDTAKEIGSVNTIVVDAAGKLHGYNTDLYGFISMTKHHSIAFEEKKVLILGNGGTSLTAQMAAKQMGAREIVVVSRTGKVNYDSLQKHHDSEIIINTTPVGMYPNNGACLIQLEAFENCTGVIDVIYNPFYTQLLLSAKKLGIPCCNGLFMLVAQAKRSAELFVDRKLQDTLIADIYSNLQYHLMNVVLVGMPGSGKSSIGKAIAEKLGREFMDTDKMIEEQSGMKIEAIFRQYGEDYFRQLEQQAIAQAGKQTGKVIATGGGAILKGENRDALKQNGIIFFIQRDVDKLEIADRPLSKKTPDLQPMYDYRFPLYQEMSHRFIDNNQDIHLSVQAVMEGFYEITRD